MSNYTWYSCGQKRKNCAWLENAKPELCRDKLKHPIRVLSRETKTFNTQLYCGDSHSMQHYVLHHTLHFQNSKIYSNHIRPHHRRNICQIFVYTGRTSFCNVFVNHQYTPLFSMHINSCHDTKSCLSSYPYFQKPTKTCDKKHNSAITFYMKNVQRE